MIYQIRFKVEITYTDYDGVDYSTSYSFFADDREDADKIARELFFMDFGTFENMKLDITYDTPSKVELDKVNRVLIEEFGILKDKFKDLSYKDFLKNYENFDGWNMKLGSLESSYYFRFMNLVCKVVYKNGESFLYEDEVYYIGVDRVYLITSNLCRVLIARG